MHNLDLNTLLYVLVGVVVIGIIDWAVCYLAPIPVEFLKLVHVICVLAAVFWALHEFGLFRV